MDHKTKTWKFWNNLIELSINKNQECVNEWQRIRKFDFDQNNEEIDNEVECICTQKHLVKIFYFKNKYNDNLIRIGSRCIKQFLQSEFNAMVEERERLMKERKELKKLMNSRCERCLSFCMKECDKCLFINDYAYSKLDNGYIKWLRKLEKIQEIKPDSILDRQIRFLNLRKINKLELKDLDKKYIDCEFNLENNYNL
jgi:hypothetical protein